LRPPGPGRQQARGHGHTAGAAQACLKSPAVERDPLAHADQAVAAAGGAHRAAAIVTDLKLAAGRDDCNGGGRRWDRPVLVDRSGGALMSTDRREDGAGVYTQTNDPGGNQIIAYRRAADGALTLLGAYDTGGLGAGKPHLASQGSVVLSDDGRWLFAVNAGSDDLSVFAVTADGLAPVDRVDAGGVRPTSVTAHQALLYVLSTAARTT
jgi:hypothetical protein